MHGIGIVPGLLTHHLKWVINQSVSLATSVDAERAFSVCMLMLGKLCTRLSDEFFHAGLVHY